MKGYSILYLIYGMWIKIGMLFFHRRFIMVGKERFPWKSPMILAPNHQNAFMDALSATLPVVERKQLSFMVRQDAFNNKIGAMFLRTMKLFPAYRMRDGMENLAKNKDSFDHCMKLLENNEGIIIFPEANHAIPRYIRPLKKGLMRIAFQAEAKNDFNLNLKVLPVGINYSDPHEAGGDVLVILGEAIDLRPYRELYEENPAKAHNALRKDLSEAMKPLAIHIENKDYYDEIEIMLCIMSSEGPGRHSKLIKQFNHSKKSIVQIETWIENNPENNLRELVNKYSRLQKKVGLRDWMIKGPKFTFLQLLRWMVVFVLFLPCFIVSFPLGYFSFTFPYRFAQRKIKDPGFRSSITFGLGLVSYTVILLILSIVLLFVLKPWYLTFAIIPLFLIINNLGIGFLRVRNRLMAMLKYNRLLKRKNKDLFELKSVRSEILDLIKS